MGMCIGEVKSFVIEVLILLTQQTVRFSLYRGVGTSSVSIGHKPGDKEHGAVPRDGRSTGTPLEPSLWVCQADFMSLRSCN